MEESEEEKPACNWMSSDSPILMEKGIIVGKLREYLKGHFLERHQQIHTHVMSIDARALVGMLFTPGLLEEEVEHIINGREGTGRKTALVGGGVRDKEEEKAAGGSCKRGGTESKDEVSWSSKEDKTMGNKREREMRLGNEERGNQGGKYGCSNRVMLRYGRIGIQSNEEWVYTIKLEKSYGGILNGNSVTLLRE